MPLECSTLGVFPLIQKGGLLSKAFVSCPPDCTNYTLSCTFSVFQMLYRNDYFQQRHFKRASGILLTPSQTQLEKLFVLIRKQAIFSSVFIVSAVCTCWDLSMRRGKGHPFTALLPNLLESEQSHESRKQLLASCSWGGCT